MSSCSGIGKANATEKLSEAQKDTNAVLDYLLTKLSEMSVLVSS